MISRTEQREYLGLKLDPLNFGKIADLIYEIAYTKMKMVNRKNL
jgi:hypothetical protein